MIAKSLYYKEHIGDIKKKKISTILYAASSIGNQINMNDSFLCRMVGQVVKRNRILFFQNLAMEMHPQKMQKKRRLFERTKNNSSPEKKLGEGHRPTVEYEIGIETSGGTLKSTSQSHQPRNPKQVCKS